MSTEIIIKINRAIREAIIYGGDLGGPYFETKYSKINDAMEDLANATGCGLIWTSFDGVVDSKFASHNTFPQLSYGMRRED